MPPPTSRLTGSLDVDPQVPLQPTRVDREAGPDSGGGTPPQAATASVSTVNVSPEHQAFRAEGCCWGGQLSGQSCAKGERRFTSAP